MFPMMASGDSAVECPSCERVFDSRRAMHVHHTKGHGESLVATEEICHNCGETFTDSRNRDRETERKFCGEDCRLEWMAGWAGENHPRYNSIGVQCAYCDSDLTRPDYAVEKYEKFFCNPKCFGAWRSERTGEDHPLWQGGMVEYGTGWNNQKKQAVRERDDYKCQVCGLEQNEQKEINGRKLAVHHIIPARKFDDPQKRNSMDNLITLCDPCHHAWEGIPLRPA